MSMLLSAALALLALLLLAAACVGVAAVIGSMVFRQWGTDTVGDWLREATARLTAGTLRRRFFQSVVSQVEILPSRSRRAYRRLEVSIAPVDVARLVNDGDLDQLAADAARIYDRHARNEGWTIDGAPEVIVVIDELVRPRNVKVRPLPSGNPSQNPSRSQRPTPPGPGPAPVRPVATKPVTEQVTEPLTENRAKGEAETVLERPDQVETQPEEQTVVLQLADSTDATRRISWPSVTVGRAVSCRVRVRNENVSREHASIYHQAGQWWIRDLDSSNGTLLDDQQIKGTGPHALAVGSKIVLGGRKGETLLVTATRPKSPGASDRAHHEGSQSR